MIQARNEGRDLTSEGNVIIREASKWSPPSNFMFVTGLLAW